MRGSRVSIARIRREALWSPEDFSRQFAELVRVGYGWINLVGNGLLQDRLLVSVELPRESSGISAEMVQVIVSGPYLDPAGNKIWHLEGRVELA